MIRGKKAWFIGVGGSLGRRKSANAWTSDAILKNKIKTYLSVNSTFPLHQISRSRS